MAAELERARRFEGTVMNEGQLEHVVLNLAINARDAMPQGGRLTLETRDALIATSSDLAAEGYVSGDVIPGGYVTLTVSDTGSGIANEVLPHIFEPFFTTKSSGQGTGLGLSMVEGFMRQSGGLITFSSQVGRGTTVRLYLPRATQEASAREEVAPIGTPGVGFETVLICDDDPQVRSAGRSRADFSNARSPIETSLSTAAADCLPCANLFRCWSAPSGSLPAAADYLPCANLFRCWSAPSGSLPAA